jgi:DNA invertase Pin-like site-specific DNA recombinase
MVYACADIPERQARSFTSAKNLPTFAASSDASEAHRPTPAAEYLRVSHDEQRWSLDTQAQRIHGYALQHGFVVVRSYIDRGRSGLVLHRRPALQQLLKDVLTGTAAYEAILVDELSRWGRFQDPDESAHYEFLCKVSGVQIHYCNESFRNDGTLPSSILKGLRRSIAGEYSRELSEKCFKAQRHLAELGFRVGGSAGYGFRRMAISADGLKHALNKGEYKNAANDHVVLVPGPPMKLPVSEEFLIWRSKRTRAAKE